MTDNMFKPINHASLPNIEGDPSAEKTAERMEKIAWIRGQVDKSLATLNTPAEKYLRDVRGLQRVWPDQSLRYASVYQHKPDAKLRPCLLAIVTNQQGEIVGIQSLEIDPKTGKKAAQTKPDRFSNGFISEGAVSLGMGDVSQTLVIGEGVETTLTRNLVSLCDSYACLGAVRFIAPKKHHKRVEILADNDKRDAARRLAKQYADLGLSAYVVTIPDALGDKADLNDLLQQSGMSAVCMAVEDAELSAMKTRDKLKDFALEVGSDVEIAHKIIERLEEIYGSVIVCDGRLWRFDRTHWITFEHDSLARFVHRADGAIYHDAEGKPRAIRLNKSRVASILDAVLKYRGQADFFKTPPCGINCESGFIQIADDGSVEHLSHARKWRQRHVVRGRWHSSNAPSGWEQSHLAKYLAMAFKGDVDAEKKIQLLGEVVGCAATGYGTRIRSPKAIVTFSEEGGTGKSTFLRLLRAMPNADAVASVPAGKFGDEKYAHRLIGKVLNAADELPDKAIKSDVFKRLITGEPIPARDVYCSAVDFVPVALHVFSTNVLPAFSGGVDGGTARRLLPIEFTNVVPEKERDPTLPDRIIREESDILLHFAVDGACRLIKQNEFTVPDSSKTLLNRWLISADPVRGWAAERLEITAFESLMSLAALYSDFEVWASQRGLKRDFLPNAISFGKRLPNAMPGLERHRSDGSHYLNVRIKVGGS